MNLPVPSLSPNRLLIRIAALALGVAASAGCSTIAYYAQSVGGQMEVLNKRQDVERLLADPDTPPKLRRQLALALEIRSFAAEQLGLPDNASYRSYTDLERPYVIWNVFATPALSLEPVRWCYPFVGCVAYRGYFDRADAEAFAERLRTRGYDVFAGPVPAYSTLGWFDDPLLNTMIHWPEPELAGLLFHELSHQVLYVDGDTTFNESFATAVEREGVRRWMAATAQEDAYQAYLRRREFEAQFINLVLTTRTRLQALYASPLERSEKHRRKQQVFAHMHERYNALRDTWQGYGYYDAWMNRELNNAQVASVATYHRYVPAFGKLLERYDGDLPAFYAAAARLAQLSDGRRNAALQALLPETADGPRPVDMEAQR